MPRPKLAEPARNEKISILLTPQERHALLAAAKRSGRTMSSYIRRAVLKQFESEKAK